MSEDRTRSEALNRPIDDWLHRISSGQLRLPSFQRGVAWEKGRIASMLTTIVHDLPLGITLILDVGDGEKFHSRPLETAPDTPTKVTEHLLDGQQRLTALWQALKPARDPSMKTQSVEYFIHLPEFDDDPDNDDEGLTVRPITRWSDARAQRRPLWCDVAAECRERGMVPVRLLDPNNAEVSAWVQAAFPTQPIDETSSAEVQLEAHRAAVEMSAKRDHLKDVITPLRERVRHYNLPYLRLPASTPKDVALRVFINMNTNAKPLSAYDIVVAEMENATGARLRELVADLNSAQPMLRRYFDDLGSAVLQVAALMQGKLPSQVGYFDLDYARLVDQWDLLGSGFRRVAGLLADEGIFDAARVPTGPALPVAAALLAGTTEVGDARARVDQVVRRYLWSAFFTSRYQSAAPTRAAADFLALQSVLDGRGGVTSVPVFDRELYPLPTYRELITAGWSKKVDRLGRAILAASTYFGARDFADDTRLSADNITRREYHHLFPDALLREAGIDSYLGLNCALITWKTNRTIGRLDPITYLEQRVERAPAPDDVKYRLATHLVPYELLAAAGPYLAELTGAALAERVRPDFEAFLDARAKLVAAVALELTEGRQPELRTVLAVGADTST